MAGRDRQSVHGRSRRREMTRRKEVLPVVVTLGLISGFGVVDNAGDRLAQPASRESQTVDRQESPENAIGADNPDMNSDIPLISGQESRLVTLQGSYAPSPGTVTELVTDETVVVGDVIASRYGETGGPRDDRVTPIYVTIRVVERIIGNRDIPVLGPRCAG